MENDVGAGQFCNSQKGYLHLHFAATNLSNQNTFFRQSWD